MAPPSENLSLTATDNPSTTTAFMLGQITSKLDALNGKIDKVTTDVDGLKGFRLKIIAIVSGICATLNMPTFLTMLQ